MKSSILTGLDEILCPNKHCVLCQQASTELICAYCFDDLPVFDLSECAHDLLNIPKIHQGLTKPEFDRLFAISPYEWPYSYLIRQLKFNQKLLFANALGQIFCRYLQQVQGCLPHAIIPVPLHNTRLGDRRYNQAYQIARQIGLFTRIPVMANVITRTKVTLPQTELTGSARRKNLKGAFSLQQPLKLQHIAVFDDVVTTGETANEMCLTIKRAHPDIRIDLWTICVSLDRQ